MRKIARYYSIFLVLIFVASIVMSVPAVMKVGIIVLIKIIGVSVVFIPFVLAAIALGQSKHRLERMALLNNQILAVVSALALAWGCMTTADDGIIVLIAASMLLLGSALNWAAMATNERNKNLALSGFGIWVLAFFSLGAATGSIHKQSVYAAVAGMNTFASYTLIGGVIALLSALPQLMRLRKPKNDSISKTHCEGNLAFRNELGEDANPYAGEDKKLADSWLSGYRKAAEASKHRVIPR